MSGKDDLPVAGSIVRLRAPLREGRRARVGREFVTVGREAMNDGSSRGLTSVGASTQKEIGMLDPTSAYSGFSVDDIDAAERFYREVLGMEVTESNGMLHLGLGSGKEVFVYPKPHHEPATFTILNFPVDDLEATVDRLTAAGIRFEQYDAPDLRTDAKGIMRGFGPDIAWFRDPAGNILSVHSR